MTKVRSILLTACAVAASTSCCSIVSKSDYPVTVTSTSPSVPFTIQNQKGETIHSATTPATVYLDASTGYFKKAKYTFNFKKGNKTETRNLDASLDPWYAGNLLWGASSVIGFIIVDPATGAMYKLDDKVQTSL